MLRQSKQNTELALEWCCRLEVGACCWSGAEHSAHRELANAGAGGGGGGGGGSA